MKKLHKQFKNHSNTCKKTTTKTKQKTFKSYKHNEQTLNNARKRKNHNKKKTKTTRKLHKKKQKTK